MIQSNTEKTCKKEKIKSKFKCFNCMQFGLSTHTKTENHSVQFTWSNLNKRFPHWAKRNKRRLCSEDEYSAGRFHFGKRCASHSSYRISLPSHLHFFRPSFNLTWIEEWFLAPVTSMSVSRHWKEGDLRQPLPILLSATRHLSRSRGLALKHCRDQATRPPQTCAKVWLWQCLQSERCQRHLTFLLVRQRHNYAVWGPWSTCR